VITFENRSILYEDCEIYAHQEQLINADFGIGKVSEGKIEQLVSECVCHFSISEPFDLFTPNKFLSLLFKLRRKFKSDLLHKRFYAVPIDNKRFDIAFHFRSFERRGDIQPKSFPHEKADQLVEMCTSHGLRVCCIGAPEYSYVPPKAENRQSNDLSTTIAHLCASRLIVGGSSAPLHLAQLCGLPIVVWIGLKGDDRYFTISNPFHSSVFMVTDKTFNPQVHQIYGAIEKAMSNISNIDGRG
jgi:ADP-heptose:LPS heptosyltransferase